MSKLIVKSLLKCLYFQWAFLKDWIQMKKYSMTFQKDWLQANMLMHCVTFKGEVTDYGVTWSSAAKRLSQYQVSSWPYMGTGYWVGATDANASKNVNRLSQFHFVVTHTQYQVYLGKVCKYLFRSFRFRSFLLLKQYNTNLILKLEIQQYVDCVRCGDWWLVSPNQCQKKSQLRLWADPPCSARSTQNQKSITIKRKKIWGDFAMKSSKFQSGPSGKT